MELQKIALIASGIVTTASVGASAIAWFHFTDVRQMKNDAADAAHAGNVARLASFYRIECKNGGLNDTMYADRGILLTKFKKYAGREYRPKPCTN